MSVWINYSFKTLIYIKLQLNKQNGSNLLNQFMFSVVFPNIQVQFFYHMLGAHINQLKLEVKEICHSPPKHYTILKLDDRNVIFEWQYAAVPLTSITGR